VIAGLVVVQPCAADLGGQADIRELAGGRAVICAT
jgi:hypothetical protein